MNFTKLNLQKLGKFAEIVGFYIQFVTFIFVTKFKLNTVNFIELLNSRERRKILSIYSAFGIFILQSLNLITILIFLFFLMYYYDITIFVKRYSQKELQN